MKKRGVKVNKLDVKMSSTCKRKGLEFVVVTLYSSTFTDKVHRLLKSCAKVDVCCKAVLAPDVRLLCRRSV